MVVGVLEVELLIDGAQSLKEKRFVLRSLRDMLRERFNVAICEMGDKDLWQRAQLGIAAVGEDRRVLNGVLDHVLDFIERRRDVTLIAQKLELV